MKRKLLLISWVFLSVSLFAEPQVIKEESKSNDFTTWATFSLNYKPIKSLTLTWTEDARFNKFSTEFDRLYSGIGISYRAHKNFSLGTVYEFQLIHKPGKPDSERFQFRHRAKLYVQPSVNFSRFTLSLREMAQMTYRMDEYNPLESVNPSWVLRSRLKLDYSFIDQPVKPYVYVEMHNPLNKVEYAEHWVEVLYYRIGVEWRIDGMNTLDFYYHLEHTLADKVSVKPDLVTITSQSHLNHVIGVIYKLDL